MNRMTGTVATAVIVLLASACTQVDTTEHCVLTRYGSVVQQKMEPGLSFTPLTTSTCFSMIEHNFPGGKDNEGDPLAERLEAQTSDPITVTGEVALVYKYDPATIFQVFTEKRSADAVEAEITNSIRSGYRAAIGRFSVAELFSSRERFSDSVKAAIQRKIGHRAIITNLFIRGIKVPEVIEQARISAAQQAQVLDKAQKQMIIDSVNARGQVLRAEGEAKAKALEANSYASNPKLLDLEIAKAKASGLAQVCQKSQTCILGQEVLAGSVR